MMGLDYDVVGGVLTKPKRGSGIDVLSRRRPQITQLSRKAGANVFDFAA